jgi:hypothetical protein
MRVVLDLFVLVYVCVSAQFHFVCTQNGRMFLEQPAMSQPVVLSEYCKKKRLYTYSRGMKNCVWVFFYFRIEQKETPEQQQKRSFYGYIISFLKPMKELNEKKKVSRIFPPRFYGHFRGPGPICSHMARENQTKLFFKPEKLIFY